MGHLRTHSYLLTFGGFLFVPKYRHAKSRGPWNLIPGHFGTKSKQFLEFKYLKTQTAKFVRVQAKLSLNENQFPYFYTYSYITQLTKFVQNHCQGIFYSNQVPGQK